MGKRPRSIPFSPTSATQLEVGDFWAVELPSGRFGAGQVLQVKRSGVGSRSVFVAGSLGWSGSDLPTVEALAGAVVVDHGLAGVEMFKNGGQVILGTVPLDASAALVPQYWGDHPVGEVTNVWGWMTVARKLALAAGEPLEGQSTGGD